MVTLAELTEEASLRMNKCDSDGARDSVQVEGDFNRLPHGRGLAVRPQSRTEPPRANSLDGLLIQAKPQSFCHAYIGGAAVSGDHRNQQHRALIFRLYGLVRELRLRAVQARRAAVTAGSSIRVTATGVVAIPRPQTIALPVADTIPASLPQRIPAENFG